MEPLSKIKKEFLKKRIGFNDKADPLYKRTDIDDLAIIALESQDPSLLRLFKKLPELSVLKKNKTDRELPKTAKGADRE